MKVGLVLIFISVVCSGAFGQSVQREPVGGGSPAKSFPIDGTPLLWKNYQEAARYVSSHPEFVEKTRLRKTAVWGFSVGSTKSWYTADLYRGIYYRDHSTCRAVGKHCYVFVDDSLWNVRVNQAAVDSIENDFDNKTPADPGKGIFVMDSLAFGAPPDVDNDPKVIILILNIRDGYTGTGGYVAGFFDPAQEVPGTYSNDAEIYYIDAYPTNLMTASGLQTAMSTTAHEFQHMINWNYHQTNPEPTFINESCSKLAEVYCGYPTSDLELYADETNHYLFDWRGDDNNLVLNDYARAQRFSLYMWDRFGIGIMKYVVQSAQTSGIGIVNDALSKDGLSLTFNDFFSDWLTANKLNDTTVNRLYGYAYPNLPASNGKNFYDPITSGLDTVQNLAAEYLIFNSGKNLKATFTNTGGNPNLSVEAIEVGSSMKRVLDVPIGIQFSEPEFGTTFTNIAFVVVNKDPNSSNSFEYDVSGTVPEWPVELKWDTTEPVGYYAWASSDTICVTFDEVPRGILDSVRVALRSAGSISGGVYQFTGVQTPTPLGRLLAPITAAISTTSPSPFPVPYQNWASVNLVSERIATDNPFAVAFVIGSNPSKPGVMVTNYPGKNPYHSYTRLNSSEASPAGWYYVTSSDTTVGIYLIRAYVSLPRDSSLAVQAGNFVANAAVGSVTLKWNTQSEVDNAGFYVLRREHGSSGIQEGTAHWLLVGSYKSDDNLKGMGTSSNGRAYGFTDNRVISGKTYDYKVQSVSTSGTTIDLATISIMVDVPKTYALYQNYPNPFNPSTTIRFDLKQSSTVTLEVFNLLGQRVMEQQYGPMNAGRYNEVVSMDRFASGVYYYRIMAQGNNGERFVSMKKMLEIK